MEIVEPIKERDVEDYDFMFVGGAKLAVAITKEAGDSVTDNGTHYSIHIAAKPGLLGEEGIDEEDLTVFKSNLAALAIRKYKQRLPTEEEQFEQHKLIHQLAKLVQ